MIRLTDEKLSNIVTDYHFSGEQNRNILVKSAVEAQLKKVVEWIDSFNDKPVGEEVRYFINKFRQVLLEEVKE